MTNKENMKKVIKNDFDRNENYKKIILKMNNGKTRTNYKYAILPTVAIIIIVLIISLSYKNNEKEEFKKFGNDDEMDSIDTSTTSNSNYTTTSNYVEIIINEIKDITKNRNNTKVVNNVNIPYFEMLSNLDIPNDFDNKEDYRAIYVKNDTKSSSDDYILNNYEFHYKNTKNDREIILSFSKDYIPVNNYNFGVNNKSSKINGFSVNLYKYDKVYIAKFQYADYNFIVEGKSIKEEDFINFIKSIIK